MIKRENIVVAFLIILFGLIMLSSIIMMSTTENITTQGLYVGMFIMGFIGEMMVMFLGVG